MKNFQVLQGLQNLQSKQRVEPQINSNKVYFHMKGTFGHEDLVLKNPAIKLKCSPV